MELDLDGQLEIQHLFLVNRMCRVCGKDKNLISDFYKCRKDATKISSYAYECKECTLKRVKEYDKRVKQKYRIGKCKICDKNNIKLLGDVCKSCTNGLKGFEYDIDTLKKAVVYLENDKETL
jgi:hypothetical protein